MNGARTIQLRVGDDDAGGRLDRWLAAAVPDMSRSRVQALIADGRLSDGSGTEVADASRKVRAGDAYTLTVPPPAPAVPNPENIPLEVLFEDDSLIVLVKPVGLVVHPAPGHGAGTLVNALLYHCAGSLSGIGGVTRPGIVHRLDKDTSGVMVCAKTDAAHHGLAEQFQVHSIDRAYKAVVWGLPSPRRDRIVSRIGRDPRNRKRMAEVSGGGKEAITDYAIDRPVGSLASLVDCRLFTGRTHQIRVQMSSKGHPLVGDPLYHTRESTRRLRDPRVQQAVSCLEGQALHAYMLGFNHPIDGARLHFEIDISSNLKELIDSLDMI